MHKLTPNDISPLRFFLKTQRSQVPFIVINSIFYSLGTVAGIGISYYLGRIIDSLGTGDSRTGFFVVLLIITLFANEIFFRIGHLFEVAVGARISTHTKKILFSYTNKLSFGYFSERFAGQIVHQISTVANGLEELKTIITNKFVDNSWMIIVSIVMLILVYPPLAIAIAIWTPLYLVGLRPLVRKISHHSEQLAEYESATTGAIVDTYANIATVKVYGTDADHDRVYDKINTEYQSRKSVGIWEVLAYAYQGITGTLLACAFVVISAYGYKHGFVTIGDLVLVIGIGGRILENVYSTGHSISSFVRSLSECRQALKDLLVVPSIHDGNNTVEQQSSVAVSYNNVSFSYGNGKNILQNFSLTVPAGQRLGVVGLSGAGKTTLVNLLLRFFDPQEGFVSINNTNITHITQESLRAYMSFISQDTSLFHMTIAENISYGTSAASLVDIQQAAQMAYADDFITALPDGYNSIVGERGIKLSGGQRQRIAIARAILKNSPLFILDEATSALDSESEAKVQDALLNLISGKTVIAIAHRLSTLQTMDRIVYIEEGRVIEDGTHSELIALNGKYAALWNMQVGGFLPAVGVEVVE